MITIIQQHYGNEHQEIQMLLEKNRDSLFEDLLNLLSTSSISLISEIYGGESTRSSTTDNMNSGNTRSSRRSGKQSIATMADHGYLWLYTDNHR